jgi:hypothetical protein
MGNRLFSPFRAWRAAFGNGSGCFPARCDLVTYIECTITGTKIIEIRIPVIAGADDVKILLLATGCKPARAGTVPVAFLIFQKSGNKIFCELFIRILPVASIVCLFLEDTIH